MKQILKYLMLAVASITTFNVKTTTLGYFCLYNDTNDSFAIKAHMPHSDYRITDFNSIDPKKNTKVSELLAHTVLGFSLHLPDGYRFCEEDGYYLSFEREGCEFKILFVKKNSSIPVAKLTSDTATELHNDSAKDGYRYEYLSSETYRKHYGVRIGHIMNWIIVGQYRVVYFYEKYGRSRGIVIEYVTDDATWMKEVPVDPETRVPIDLGENSRFYGWEAALRPQPKSWFAEHFCCCCGD